MPRVAWDVSHQEFTIEDYYYYSVLKNLLRRNGIHVEEIQSLWRVFDFDVLVLNYPEIPFNREEVGIVKKFLMDGGRVIVLGYYLNKDHVADTVNSLSLNFGVRMNRDIVVDECSNHNGDKFFVLTRNIYRYNENVRHVLMPCTASLELLDGNVDIVIRGEETSKSDNNHQPVIAAVSRVGWGEFIVIGTCVFWDNYSIDKFDNINFALNLLSYQKRNE